MTNNDREKSESQTSGNANEMGQAKEAIHPYHAPTLTTFGTLAELVQNNPAVGSDGGTGDCQHA